MEESKEEQAVAQGVDGDVVEDVDDDVDVVNATDAAGETAVVEPTVVQTSTPPPVVAPQPVPVAATPVRPVRPATAWGPTPTLPPAARQSAVHRRVEQLLLEAQQEAADIEMEAQAQARELLLQTRARRQAAAAVASALAPTPTPAPTPALRGLPSGRAGRAPRAPHRDLAPRMVVVEDDGMGDGSDGFGGCDGCGGRGYDCDCRRRHGRRRREACDFRPRYADNCCPVSCFPSVGCTTPAVLYGGGGGCGPYLGAGCGYYGGYDARLPLVSGACGPCGSPFGIYGAPVPLAVQQPVTSLGSVCGPSGCALTMQPAVQTCTLGGGCYTTPIGPPNLAGPFPSWL